MRYSPVFLCVLVIVCACAGPTRYQRLGVDDQYGYRELALGDSIYRVAFAGNDKTNIETVDRYALYRCAEVTLDHGGNYFELIADGGRSSLQSSEGFIQNAEGAMGLYSTTSIEHTTFKTIRIHAGAFPTNDASALDPQILLKDKESALSGTKDGRSDHTTSNVIVIIGLVMLAIFAVSAV